jgi:hypothetical protein
VLFCLTGTGRCGTKVLRGLLDAHPDLFVYDETHWIPKMFEFFGTGDADVDALLGIVRRTYYVTGTPTTALDEAQLRTALGGRRTMTVAEFCDALGVSFARRHGKTLWADKTPDYGPSLHVLQTLWPNCRVVHLVRHGLEVALSMSRHPGFRWMASARDLWWCPASFNQYYRAVPVTDRPFVDFLDLWYWRLLRIRNEATRLAPGTYLEVRFEDLIERPADTLRGIASFVDLPSPDDWLTGATALIDPRRIRSRARDIPRDGLNDRHRALLDALAYR